MKNSMLIVKKELARVFKDKQMIISLFVLPVIIMFGIYGLMGSLTKSITKDIEEHESVVYIQNAPAEIKDLAAATGYNQTAHISYLNDNTSESEMLEIKDGILAGTNDLLVVFDKDFKETFSAYTNAGDEIPEMTLFYNSAESYSSQAKDVFNAMMAQNYRTMLQAQRFGNLDLLTVFSINEEKIVNEAKENGQFLSMMLPYLIVMLLFASAMSICVDAIAGEKERGTLSSLLLSPIKRSELAFGKLFGLAILSSMSAIVYAVSSIFSMGSFASSIDGGEGVTFSFVQILELAAIMVVLVYMFVAIVCAVSILAKDTKQASSYVSPLYIVVIVLGLVTMLSMGKSPSDIMYLIPVYGSAMAIQGITIQTLTGIQFLFTILGSLVFAALATYGVKKAFDSEKIMFNA
ncbi:MAG: ABC transporter permease subunit [Lachnospiraceae bacterium]|nr:ABC transporter permease subunit [Lachnospiraceae bacterium]